MSLNTNGYFEDKLIHHTDTYFGNELEFEVPVFVYPSQSDTIIIQAPGAGQVLSGRHNAYQKLGQHLSASNLCAYVSHNAPQPDAQWKFPDEPYSFQDTSWNKLAVESLEHTIDYTIKNAISICRTNTPKIILAGFSAGGSSCGAVAYKYPEIEKILLVSSYDSVGDYFYEGIGNFTGRLFVTYGSSDGIAKFLAYSLSFLANSSKEIYVEEIPNCDHGFRGEENGKILSNAYKWVLETKNSFPSPADGIFLYNE
tara:strand:+ start:45735 stop:46499 length:765 start_codon:yes stop_codon:yes gene_type:complete